MAQSVLFQVYKNFDALVHPSLFEGFGLVIPEAMAAGLPVITTPNSIGPELMTEGQNGYIVPIRNADMLEEAIVHLRNKTNEQYTQVCKAARAAALHFSWSAYQSRLSKLLESWNTYD